MNDRSNPSRRPTAVPSEEEQEIARLVSLAQDGDTEAFEQLVRIFQDRVFRRAMYRLRDEDEANDLAQEVFLTCFRKIHQFRGESKFWTWLCRIVDNLAINRISWLKRRGKDRTYSLEAGPSPNEEDTRSWDPADTAADPRREVEGREAVENLNRCLSQLSPEHREILLLRFSEQLSYDEIARTLNISDGTVKSRISRARAELRSLMSEYLDNRS